jgi:hypothetical protein
MSSAIEGETNPLPSAIIIAAAKIFRLRSMFLPKPLQLFTETLQRRH